MPRPPERQGEINDELLITFERAIALRAERDRLKDELVTVEKRLRILMREAFGGEHWQFGCPSPADDALDVPRHHPIGNPNQLDMDWPLLARDRAALLVEHAAWKQRRGSNAGSNSSGHSRHSRRPDRE
jgi:hypothetical protein